MDVNNAASTCTKEKILEKISKKDYNGARTLILEALKMSPLLEHACEMLTVCEILCIAESKLRHYGTDWYLILQLSPSAELADIEAKYSMLASQLNSIKNDLPGSEVAINLVREAFSVLSDPVKRATFDSKRSGLVGAPCASNSKVNVGCCKDLENPVAVERAVAGSNLDLPGSSGSKRAANETSDYDADQKEKKICSHEANSATSQRNSNDDAGLYLKWPEENVSSLQLVARKRCELDFYDFENNRKAELFSTGQIWVVYDQENMPRKYARIDKIMPDMVNLYVTWFKPCLPQPLEEMRWLDAGLPVTCGSFLLELNKCSLSRCTMLSHLLADSTTQQQFEIYPKKGEIWAIYRDWNIGWYSNPAITKKCDFVIVEILTDYLEDSGVTAVYLFKVSGYKNIYSRCLKRGNELFIHIPRKNLFMFSHNVPGFRFKGGEIDGISKGMLELDPLAIPNNLFQDFSSAISTPDAPCMLSEDANCNDKASLAQLSSPCVSTTDSGGSNAGVPVCKPKWSAKDFTEEQVWAVYDGPDAMPRLYVKVNNVPSPHIVSVTFLEPHPVLDEEIQWVEENLPIACGIFRAGRIAKLEMSRFSHLVKCDRTKRKSFYKIFPRKGEIWAVYKKWNKNWKSSDFVGYQCRVVEILSDFSEESGANVCSLVEVEGYMTFFMRQLHEGFQLTKQLQRLEMLSFSHRIPAFTVVGIKNHAIPEGSWHLEPDALPKKALTT